MTGLGTIINSAAIIAGGVIGHFTGKLFRQDQQDTLNKACGISVLFIAIAGAMQGMLHIDNGTILSGKSMLVVLSLALGTITGEMIGIEKGFIYFGEWLKEKSGNSGDKQFVNALEHVEHAYRMSLMKFAPPFYAFPCITNCNAYLKDYGEQSTIDHSSDLYKHRLATAYSTFKHMYGRTLAELPIPTVDEVKRYFVS